MELWMRIHHQYAIAGNPCIQAFPFFSPMFSWGVNTLRLAARTPIPTGLFLVSRRTMVALILSAICVTHMMWLHGESIFFSDTLGSVLC
jgi:hypothetical protein